jgi:G:T-mismatch repair DNA endonuclease (very short patch repair protein)
MSVIETYGDYWHASPTKYTADTLDSTQRKNIRRDHSKVVRLNKLGYNILVLWESDLKQRQEECFLRLKEFLHE